MTRRALALLLGLIALATGLHAAAAVAAPPAIHAPEAIAVEQATGDVVFARDADRRRPMASTTKLMTALLVLEHLPLDDVVVEAPYAGAPAESIAGFRAGERLTVRDELRALLVVSANDAAHTLALRVGGTQARFVAMMNARARRIGLRNTHYANPIGLDDPENYSSAADLVKLALILRTKPFFRDTVNEAHVTLRSGARPRTLVNRNTLVDTVPYVTGVKTGHTNRAGYILVGSATRHGVSVVSAVLADPSEAVRDSDSLALLRYALGRYTRRTVVERGEVAARVAEKDRSSTVALVAERSLRRTARRGEQVTVVPDGVPDELDGPLPQGARVATLVVRQRGHVVARVPLVTRDAVDEAGTADRLRDFFSRAGTLVVLAVFVGGSLLLVLLRRRAVRRRRGHPEGESGLA